MYGEAISELQKAVQASGRNATCIANLARAYAAAGQKSKAKELLRELQGKSNGMYSHGSEIAMIYASLGDRDQAMIWLRKGYEERFNPGVLLRPGLDPLRSDARFLELEQQIGLPH
jgi:tetratricopeptide (TPR) repeat protein